MLEIPIRNIYHENQLLVFRLNGEWAKISKLPTPPKLRSFLWRAARDFLPCRLKLQSRNIQVPSCCVICESGLENNWHVFIDCPYAKECWKIAKLDRLVMNCAKEAVSFTHWLFESLNKFPKAALTVLSATLWSIWRYRNEKLWNGVSRPPQITVSLGHDMVWNWTQTHKTYTRGQAPSSRRDTDDRWTKPLDPYVKCNVDAAMFHEHQAVGFGAVVRDSTGEFMVSKTSVKYGMCDVKEAEALALFDAIAWTISVELQDIIFETDSLTVLKAITSKNADHTEFGSIISGCQYTSRRASLSQNSTCSKTSKYGGSYS
ncbi:uncharacterized protein [Primulina eburnea]|uniref:uncharacterized protein n=1 Tax=Primulina eburnea TaxID=1245227 RepID=UPI003C6C1A28